MGQNHTASTFQPSVSALLLLYCINDSNVLLVPVTLILISEELKVSFLW